MPCRVGLWPSISGSVALNDRREDGGGWMGAVFLAPIYVGRLCKSAFEVYAPVCTLVGCWVGQEDVSKSIMHPRNVCSPGVDMRWPAAGPGSCAVLVPWHAQSGSLDTASANPALSSGQLWEEGRRSWALAFLFEGSPGSQSSSLPVRLLLLWSISNPCSAACMWRWRLLRLQPLQR